MAEVDRDLDFAARLDALDEPEEAPAYVLPQHEPAYDFALPGSTRKLIDDAVGARDGDREISDFRTALDTSSQQAEERAKAPGYKGVFGESWGVLTPEESQQEVARRQEGAQRDTRIARGVGEMGRRAEERYRKMAPDEPLNPLVAANLRLTDEAAKRLTKEAASDTKRYGEMASGQRQPPILSTSRAVTENVAGGFIDLAGSITKGIGEGIGFAGEYLGADTAPDKNTLYSLGRWTEAKAKELFPADEARQKDFSQKLARGAGSMVGFYGPAIIGRLAGASPSVLLVIAGGSGAAATGNETFEDANRARKEGIAVTDRQRFYAYAGGLLLGTSEAAPIATFLRGAGRYRAAAAIQQSLEEGGQEAGQQLGQNALRKFIYDPNQSLTEGVDEAFRIGATLGMGMGGAMHRRQDDTSARAPADVRPEIVANPETAKPTDSTTTITITDADGNTRTQTVRGMTEATRDARVLAASQPGGPQPLAPGQGQVRGPRRADPVADAVESVLGEIESGITTDETGQTSFVAPVTVREQLQAEAAKPLRGGNAVMDEGLFGGGASQTDLVDMAREAGRTDRAIANEPTPTFDEMRAALPPDSAGDPDVVALASRITQLGKNSWAELTPQEKVAVFRSVAPETPIAGAGVATGGQTQILATPVAQTVNASPAASQGAISARAPIQPQSAARTRLRREAKPVSIVDFIRQRGGIRDDGGDVRAMDGLRRPGLINNRAGLDLDKARELAVEAGYLQEAPDSNALETSTADLLDLISEDLAGRRVYSQADADRVANLRGEADAAVADQRLDAYVSEVEGWLAENGLQPNLSEAELRSVAELMSTGVDVDTAVERIIFQSYEAEAERGTDQTGTLGSGEEIARAIGSLVERVGEALAQQSGGDLRSAGQESRAAGSQITDAERSRFAAVLASKERRANWGRAAQVDAQQLEGLISEAVADGRLTLRKGEPVRTPKARQPAAQPATMDRSAEVRLDRLENPIAYKHAAAILQSTDREAALKILAADKKATRAVLDAVHEAVTGKPSKSMRTKGAVIEALRAYEAPAAQPAPSPAPVETPADLAEANEIAEGRFVDVGGKRIAISQARPDVDGNRNFLNRNRDRISGEEVTVYSAELGALEDAIADYDRRNGTAPMHSDSYAVRAANAIADEVVREHYDRLARVGVDQGAFDRAVARIETDRRLTPEDRADLAGSYIGTATDGDPVAAIRQAFEARARQARLAELRGLDVQTMGSNLRVRDTLDRDNLVARLEAMAERLPSEVAFVIRSAINNVGGQVGSFEGLTTTPENARAWFAANPGVAERVLAVSLEYGPDVALKAFTHEEIHILREVRALLGPEWKILEGLTKRRPKKAQAEALLDGRRARGQISAEDHAALKKNAGKITYRELYQIDATYRDYTRGDESRLVEETVAHIAADWVDGHDFGGKVDEILTKIRDLIEAIRNALNGLGFRSANDIFESIWAGEVVRQHEMRRAEHEAAKTAALDWMDQNGVIAMAIRKAEPAAAIQEVWGTKFQTLMSEQYQIAVAGEDLATQYDILSAKYNNALSDPPEMREAMKAEIDRLRPIVETQDAELRAELKRKFGALTDRTMFAIAGENAMGADREALGRAKRMEERGQSRERIWTQTGWYRGVDGKWRFEIDDSSAQLRAFGPDKSLLPLELTHDALFDAYPDLHDLEYNRVPGRGGGYMNMGDRPSYMNVGKESRSRKSVTLHETQHAIQDVEGFAEGGSPSNFTAVEIAAEQARLQSLPQSNDWTSIDNIAPDDITSIRFNLYQRLAGEVEARMVQTRLDMTPAERKERAPWHDYDVPEAEQIVKMPDEFASLRSSIEDGPGVRGGIAALAARLRDRITAWRKARGAEDRLSIYNAAQTVDDFMKTRFVVGDGNTVTVDGAYDNYRQWAESTGQPPMASVQFRMWLRDQGYRTINIAGRERFVGIGWTPEAKFSGMEDLSQYLDRRLYSGRPLEAANDQEASGDDAYAIALARQRGLLDESFDSTSFALRGPLLRSSIEEADQPRRSKEGFELQLPFRDRWGDPRFDAADRERAITRLKEIQTIKTMSASWADLNQAFDDVHAITANLLFYRPGADLSTMASRVGSDVGMYAFERKYGRGDLLHRRSLFSAEELPDEVQEFAQEGRAALEHLLRSRRAGIRDLAGDESTPDPRLKNERNSADVGEKMQSGFYFKSARALDEVPDGIFPQGGWAVINHLRQAGVRKAEVDHFQLAEKLGNEKPVTREAFQEAINERAFDFRRKTSWLNPERSPRDYELGGTRAFTGPRVPGRGTYFERLVAFPKKLRGGETFAPGMFQSPHWEETHKGTWGSWRGSEREITGLGKTIVGEEGQSDFMQGAIGRGDDWTGRRPRIATDEYLGLKAERPKFEQTNSDVESLLMVALRSLPYDNTRRDLIGRLKPSVMRDDATPESWDAAIAEARALINTDERFARDPSRVLGELETLDRLVALRDANPDHFAPGAFEKYARTEENFTPESPIDDNWVRTLVRDLMLLAAQRNADAIAISTSETTNRIQANTTASAAHFYDGQLKTALERELRTVTGDGSITLEAVTLPKAQGAPRNEKPFTVWAAKLPAEARAKIQSEGMTMFAVRDWGRGRRRQTPPTQSAPGEVPELNKILAELQKSLGMTVSQGLWGMTLRQGNRTIRVRPASNVLGQTDRDTGNISVRESRDIKTIAHEGGHHVEALLGSELDTLKQQHAQELAGQPTTSGQQLSEAFADWFRSYVLDRAAAEKQAPQFTAAFRDLLEAERTDLLTGLDAVADEYQTWASTAPIEQVTSGIVSQYDNNTFTELRGDAMLDNVSSWLSTGYQGVVDALHPLQQGVRYLLKIADANGIRDAQGRPISLKTSEDAYKLMRMFAGSYNRGRVWLESGVSDLVTGQTTGPSLKAAVEAALGGNRWSKKRYESFNQYLVSIRALEEYNRLDEKELALARYDSLAERIGDARRVVSSSVSRDQATLERREEALIRASARRSDRRRALGSAQTNLNGIQRRMDEIRADIAEADEVFGIAGEIDSPIATNAANAQYRNLRGRRVRSLQMLERDQRRVLREVEALTDGLAEFDLEASMLENEIEQLSGKVDAGRQRLDQLDEMRTSVRKERDATAARGANKAPTLEPKSTHERVVAELASPEFQQAADMVHDFAFSLLQVRHQAGFINDEIFDELSKRRDWYVPFYRDLSDVEGASAMFPKSGSKRWTKFKKFNGSDRSIMAPLEILSQEAYTTAQQIAFNDVVKALVNLAETVGPGGGAIAERLERTDVMDPSQENFDKIKDIAIGLGIDPIDAHLIVQRAEMNFSDSDVVKVILSPENLGPKAKPSLPLWENGERVMVRLPNPDFAKAMFDAINAVGAETQDIFVGFFGKSSSALRVGVTTSLDFIGANLYRDMWAAWKVTGAAPILTHIRGARIMLGKGDVAGIPAEDFQRLYNEAGGIAGGINVNAQAAQQQRDVRDLLGTEINWKSTVGGAAVGGAFGAGVVGILGGAAGLLVGGPVGGIAGAALAQSVGFTAGAAIGGYAGRHGEVFRMVESVETAARLGVAAHAYKRAIAYNPDLTQSEAILQAAFDARDYLDWNRRGSKMLVTARAIPFLLSYVNGMTKNLQQGLAWGARGSGVARQSKRKMADVLQRRTGIVWKHQIGDVLSADEQAELAEAYMSYARLVGLTMILLSIMAAGYVTGDDDYDDIKDSTKAREDYIKINGVWVRLPVPFELAFIAKATGIVFDKMRGGDDRVLQRLGATAYELLAPPTMMTGISLISGTAFNARKEGWTSESRPVVSPYLMKLPPHERFDAYTSQVSTDFAKALFNLGIPADKIPAPKKIDFVLTTLGGHWGREAMSTYENAKTAAGLNERPAKRATDIPVVRRFIGDAARQSRAVDEFWKMNTDAGGEMTIAANGYRQRMDLGDAAGASVWLGRLDPEQRIWALTQYHGSISDKREHPLARLDNFMEGVRDIQADIVRDTLAPKHRRQRRQVRDFDREIHLTPQHKTEIIDMMTRLAQIEARNTMVLLQRDGFRHMDIKDPKLILDEMKASSPEVHRHFDDLMHRKKVRDWDGIAKDWPNRRQRILERNADAF